MVKLVKNKAGRLVPEVVNGKRFKPYVGVWGEDVQGRHSAPRINSIKDFPRDGNKLSKDLVSALKEVGIEHGMTISTHHHLRNGDAVALMLFDAIRKLGIRDIMWFPSASFPCHAPLIEDIKTGVIHHIEGSMNGPLGEFCSRGGMKGLGVLRSHGGRYQAVQDGEVNIDIAVIAAPTADPFGNANGLRGPSACGGLGFALADSLYADKVIVVTDNLEPFPAIPFQINGNHVDKVVKVESIGDAEKIVSGTTRITRSPERLKIAEYVARFIDESGILRQGFSFQAGAGGISLAFIKFLKEIMKKKNIKAGFARGGATEVLVSMLEEGLVGAILDGQTFDTKAVRSLAENPRHIMTSPLTSYNFHSKGSFCTFVDVVVLGATEVDLNFNGNVVSHSDGLLLHGIGGWQNRLFAGCTILAVPSIRNRIPVIVDEVTTLVGPGELIDVIVTERGIAINPLRKDLIEAVKGSTLPIRSIQEIKEEAERICGGKPEKPWKKYVGGDPVAVVKWVDGTILDTLWKIKD